MSWSEHFLLDAPTVSNECKCCVGEGGVIGRGLTKIIEKFSIPSKRCLSLVETQETHYSMKYS